jgi:tetratricopeptide (TPR) repeat protein
VRAATSDYVVASSSINPEGDDISHRPALFQVVTSLATKKNGFASLAFNPLVVQHRAPALSAPGWPARRAASVPARSASDLEKAAEWLDRLIAIEPRHGGAHYQLGKIALQQKRLDDAVAHLEVCTRVDPDNKGAHYQLSRAFRLKGENEKADVELAAFRALGSQMPDDAAWREQRLERIGTRPAGVPK